MVTQAGPEGLLISSDPPLDVRSTSTAMGGFETSASSKPVTWVDFLPHGTKLAVECHGIRYQTLEKALEEHTVTNFDNINVEDISNTLTSMEYIRFLKNTQFTFSIK